MLKIKIKYFRDVQEIKPFSVGNWIDLRAGESVSLRKWDFYMIPLGVGMKLPEGYEAHVVPRSSTFKNFGILQTNSMGVIDNSYCGDKDEWKMPVIAVRDTYIEAGSRICQFRIVPIQPEICFEEVEELDKDSRGGFGSTGIC